MALIEVVSREEAKGVVKEGYKMFMEKVGTIPAPLRMLSGSPELFRLQLQRIAYLSSHPNLGFSLLAHIRYLVAHQLDYPFCSDFNKHILEKQGVTEEDFKKMEQDPSQSLLEEKDSAMLAFVVQSVKDPTSIGEKDIAALKECGWDERDMIDALAQGVSMIDHSIMMQVFQMDQRCMVD